MEIHRDVSLKEHTTFKLGGPAAFFVSAKTDRDVAKAVSFARENNLPWLVLGGGSNMLISDEGFPGVVIHIELRGVTQAPAGDELLVRAAAGEDWDAFVATCIANGAHGIENLSGIPGTVGATPIQNVGAYGTEVCELIEWVDAYDTNTNTNVRLSNSECKFEYRDSVFKRDDMKHLIVLSVCFRLHRAYTPRLAYRDLAEYFASWQRTPTAHDVRRAVLEIRSRKFPPLDRVGTAGSFFKNPIVAVEVAGALAGRYPKLPTYPLGDGRVKISISWLLDHVLGLRGVRHGAVGTYPNHVLALVHYGGGTAADVHTFANAIRERVHVHFNIDIEREVTCVQT